MRSAAGAGGEELNAVTTTAAVDAVGVGDHLVVQSEKGKVYVVEVNPERTAEMNVVTPCLIARSMAFRSRSLIHIATGL